MPVTLRLLTKRVGSAGHNPVVRDPGRRRFLSAALGAAGGALVGGRAGPSLADGEPAVPASAASGDVSADSAVVWARATRPSRVLVEWSPSPSLADARR